MWSRGRGLTWRSQVGTNPIPIPHPTNLALFGHKITLYRFNQGAHIGAGGWAPTWLPVTLTTACRLSHTYNSLSIFIFGVLYFFVIGLVGLCCKPQPLVIIIYHYWQAVVKVRGSQVGAQLPAPIWAPPPAIVWARPDWIYKVLFYA